MFADESSSARGVLLQEEVPAGQRDQRRACVLRLRREPLRGQLALRAARQDGIGGEIPEMAPRRGRADRLARHRAEGRREHRAARQLDLHVGPVDEAPADVGGERLRRHDVEGRAAPVRLVDRLAVGPYGAPPARDRRHVVAAIAVTGARRAERPAVGRERNRLAEKHATDHTRPLLVDEHRKAATEGLPDRHGLVDAEVAEHGKHVGRHLGEAEAGACGRRVGAAVAA